MPEMKTTQEVVTWVDNVIASAMADALADVQKEEPTEESKARELSLIGAIGGSMIKNGMAVMARAGVPKDLLRGAVEFALEEMYK